MYLAQVNIAKMKGSMESDIMTDFVANLDPINELAERSEGFIWRLKGDDNNALAIRIFEDDYLIINMSVWEDLDSLFKFVYQSDHLEIYKRKKEWFHNMEDVHMAFWYVKEDSMPTSEQAREKLEYINEKGETPLAFTFRNKYTPADFVAHQSLK